MTEIQEYSAVEAALTDLAARYKGIVFDVTTIDGMKSAKLAKKELAGYRISLENMRKVLKEPALRRSQMLDTEARRITAALEALEAPIDAQIKAETDKEKRAVEARLKAEADRLAAEEQARKAAEEAKMAAERAEIAKAQAALAEQERQARQKIEEEARAARLRIEEEERAARAAREEADRAAKAVRDAEEAKIKAERDRVEAERAEVVRQERLAQQARDEVARVKREQEEAAEREKRRRVNELADARTMLELFRKRFGHREEFAGVVKAIDELLGVVA